MVYISLYLVTAIVFLMLDVMMLKKVLYPLFSSNIGAIMNEDPKMGPAGFLSVLCCWDHLVRLASCLGIGTALTGFCCGVHPWPLGLWNI